ncbi:MAG: hypothetical protein JWO08_4431 [Verrucomicrobiaceae bacterium]|nr:hypothetical protein [Verrucomicrobiaceae bacterium]
MNVLKLFAKCILIIVMIPLVLQIILEGFAIYASLHTHADSNTLSKAVAAFAVSVGFLAFLGLLSSKLSSKRAEAALK